MNIPLPEYLGLTKHIDVRIGSLRQEQAYYDNYPLFQREKVWPHKMKPSLIDSILRGYPIPELLGHQKDNKLWIIDGQQRLSTIFEYMADGFPTARLKEDPCLQPIEPNKRFSRLSSENQTRFENYTLRISIIEDMDERELGALFRRLQHQQTLLLAEKLWTFPSEASHHADVLTSHPFWQKMYHGRQTRKRTFLASLYLVAMELAHGTTNLTAPCLRDLAAGTQDSAITPTLLETMQLRLAYIDHMFQGTYAESVKDLVPLYQAIILLEKADCDFQKSKEGCLTPWFAHVKQDSLEARKTYGVTDLLSKIVYSRYQLDFWSDELPKLREADGICIIDQKRAFSRFDREQAIAKQQGKCDFCHQPLSLSDIGHHIILHSKGGPTTPENCKVFHQSCHEQLHALASNTKWEQLQEA